MLNSTKTWREEQQQFINQSAKDINKELGKTWEEEYYKLFNNYIGSCFECCEAEDLMEKQIKFISDLRKRDMEALIEMLNEEKFIQVGNFNDKIAFDRKGYRVGFIAGLNANQAIDKSKQLIKDYYEN